MIKDQLITEHAGLTIIGFLVFGMVVLFFKNEPENPPSVSRARVLNVNDTNRVSPLETAKSFVRLLSSRNFVLLCSGYGLLVGVYYAISGNLPICLPLEKVTKIATKRAPRGGIPCK